MGDVGGGPVSAPSDAHEARPTRWFWVGLAFGWAVIAYGIWGALANADRTEPIQLAAYVVGAAVLHDAVVVPVVVAVGWLASRWLPPAARGPVRGALALSALLVVFAYPLVRRLGAHPTNSSALPLHYGPNLALVLGVVWVVTALLVVSRYRHRRPQPSGSGATSD